SYSGKANFDRCLAVVVRMLAEYKTSGTLPSSISSWPSDYTTATLNCESDNATIIAHAESITSGLTDTEAKAKAIYNWVLNNVTYSYYENTKRSALDVHNDRIANCCDHGHYTVALARAIGIPARYAHIDGYWGSTVYGHVYAELFVNGEWVTCDNSMKTNTYGNHERWTLKEHKANFVELYF
ncbi:MAG: transglutaminase domain-containing protein, partial [Clostridia bacterium]|nr:transglutaminase domain-containing protein [Clostridia bacterium]